MIVDYGSRPSDVPFVQEVYQARSIGGGSFVSTAASHWEMVITKQKEKVALSIRGPETSASPAPIPADAEFLGIIFNHGMFLPRLPGNKLVDHEVHLLGSSKNSIQLFDESWEIPNFENVDTFVNRLLRKELLAHDQVVDDVLRGETPDLSLRSIQRRFLHVTGLTYKRIQQIERAHKAVELLQSGVPILDATYQTGYFDQAHLTRSLKLLYGQTPGEIVKSG
jgi:AraC-like DNA-binding protein